MRISAFVWILRLTSAKMLQKLPLNLPNFHDFFRYAVPNIPYSIAASVSQAELNTLVNTLLQESAEVNGSQKIDFEFLVFNEFLR